MYTVTRAARISRASLDSEFSKAAAVPWKPACTLAGKFKFLASLVDGGDGLAQRGIGGQVERNRDRRKLTLVVDRERFRARFTWVKALSGTALLGVELVLVLAELDPVVLVLVTKAFVGRCQYSRRRAYREPTRWLHCDPAVAEADAEKEVLAAAPEAPEEALAWMYILFSFSGSSETCGCASRITWYWLSCVYMVLIWRWPKAS